MQNTGKLMVSVEKIGGTSMSAFGDVLRHIMLYDKSRILGRIYVVSAYSGVTNQMLEHKKTGERGIYALFAEGSDYHGALDALAVSLKKLNAGFADLALPLDVADAFVDTRIGEVKKYLDAMQHVLASGYIRRQDVLLAAREVLASMGESHSAFNSVEILKANGVNAILLDLAGFHDDKAWTIDERIHNSFKGLDLDQQRDRRDRLHQGHRRHHARVRPRLFRGHLQQDRGRGAPRRGGDPQGVPPLLGRPQHRRSGERGGRRSRPTTTSPTSSPTSAWRRSTPRRPSRWSSPASRSASRTPSSPITRAR